MESLKKHFEIYKINKELRSLNREMASASGNHLGYMGQLHSPYQSSTGFTRPSEKQEIIRRVINDLTEKRESIRRA